MNTNKIFVFNLRLCVHPRLDFFPLERLAGYSRPGSSITRQGSNCTAIDKSHLWSDILT
jgi:hypothetical protein